jgi:hypothetical protein
VAGLDGGAALANHLLNEASTADGQIAVVNGEF